MLGTKVTLAYERCAPVRAASIAGAVALGAVLVFGAGALLDADAAQAQTASGWQKIAKAKKAYYRGGECVTGLQKIGKHRYLFSANGVLRTKTTKIGKATYYVNPNTSRVEGMKYGATYYYANGMQMTKADSMDFATFQRARRIVAKLTKPTQSKAAKRLVCFKWVMKGYYAVHRAWSFYRPGWTALYADDRFKNRGGDCISDASAFAYLAAAIGYKNVGVGVDGKNIRDPHSWTMIGKAVYDPLFAESKSFAQYYGATSGVYEINPGGRINVAYFSAKHAKKSAKKSKRDLSKAGLTKIKGKLYYYSNGRKLKKTWKTVGKKRYYFNAKGAALTGSAKVKGTYYVFSTQGRLLRGKAARYVALGKKTYRVSKSGKAVNGLGADSKFCRKNGELLCGVDVIDGKFYAASAQGVYDASLTSKLRSAAVRNKPVATLRTLLGAPLKTHYASNCEGFGPNAKDGIWTYAQFKVVTLDKGDGSPELFRFAE